MPNFFDKNKLTTEQQLNWNKAISQFNYVINYNVENNFKNMTEEEKSDLIKFYHLENASTEEIMKKLKNFYLFLGNHPGSEKSALFSRILNGGRIFKKAPPISYSYPNYSLIEENKNFEIYTEEKNDLRNLIREKNEFCKYNHIIIHQAYWKVLELFSPTKILITYKNWEEDNFIWELNLEEISLKNSNNRIIPHHNPSLGNITTYEELKAEALYSARKHFYCLELVLSDTEYLKFLEENKSKNIHEFYSKQQLDFGKKILDDRRRKGLPDKASEEEILAYAENQLNKIYMLDYFVKDGILFKKSLILKRISPKILEDDVYLTFPENL